MKTEDQIKALAELDEKLYVIHKPIHDPFGYYRENGCGYTTLSEAWRVTEEVGKRYTGGRPTDPDRVVLEPAPTKPYHSSYDAIIPLVRKIGMCYEVEKRCRLNSTPAQLCEALLRATNKWTE